MKESKAQRARRYVREAFSSALPIMLGYVAIGIPCGILCHSIGLGPLHVFILSALFYSGAGQFMIPNMWLAGAPIASIIASVSLVNTRQMLYAASFAPQCIGVKKWLAFLFSATVTDESFGVNTVKFEEGRWTVGRATLVNLLSQTSWTLSNVAGAIIGSAINVPVAIASFAMTSIFICLLVTQKITLENVLTAVAAMVGVFVCKAIGLTGPAILIGAIIGVVVGMAVSSVRRRGDTGSSPQGGASSHSDELPGPDVASEPLPPAGGACSMRTAAREVVWDGDLA